MQFTEMLIPMVAAFAITVILMPLFIGYMRMKKEGQTIREVGPKWHKKKNGTPTMGGMVFILAIVVAAIFTGWWQHQLTLSVWAGLFILVLYGALGFWDDFISVELHRNMGLKAWQKLLGQIVGGAVFLTAYFHEGFPTVLPLFGYQLNVAWVFAVFALFWLVGFSNAVNLSDGLDGLVAGLSMIAFAAYAVLAVHDGRTDVLILCLVTIGAMVGFFLFNHKPAKVFMGDTGSLALGGLIAVIALLLDRPWSLLLIGIVFVCETASVILQVGSFKLFHRRIFKMAPIHHHFELLGWSEWKVDTVFWLVGLIGAVLYLVYALA
ncbi:phospho-N-acetylmuramoyl-pentapeptide-transferase [Lacticaseibacillus camelliae]|uniref:Phospho-N-acetylmuramoyl-pentapeptide-transferase n=1 Tax=Lacticaseibacillus camelliae DSM 22697 = JCM 13995 TaxID=1423730 RepID=A0A0R2FB10_9LACO|nr:phospho-N-acetylmuramoyl-pentapeptide-transferase [Lacticaseibacillus camelliae]KRN25585.1 phospho-N-acetylmuramoyl-pentapeptide-transferase [Lacticaseibacillus camelliae DSM 22697 = JCM 13995]